MKRINKNIFICALLVIMMLVCVNAASANDAFDDSLASDDVSVELSASGDTIYVDSSSTADDEQGTQSSPYKTISNAVGKATGGETIFIKNGTYSESARIELTADKPLSFIGESSDGVKITATAKNGLFYNTQSGSPLVFKNLTFYDITSGNYAPIYLGGNSQIDISDCNFNNCGGKFGSVYVYTSDVATIDNCNIIDSKATVGSGSAAIGIAGSGTTNIKNTLIDGAKYTGSSGYALGVVATTTATAVANLDNVTISNSNVIANSVLFTRSKMTVKNSKIINNTVNPLASGYQGDSIIFVGANSNYKGDLTIEQSVISDNDCTVGSILKTNAAAAKLTMNYNNIQNNSFNTTFTTGSGSLDLECNYWGSNTLPAGLTANVWVVEEDGAYKLSNGNALEKEIPELNAGSGEEPVVEPTVKDTIYVDSVNGLNTNDGLTEATAVKTIEKAVELATDLSDDLNENEIAKIIIKEGTYVENPIIVTETIMFNTTGPVTWDANGKRTLYVKDGASVSLSNITFINGNETYSGSVIRQDYGVVAIDNCVFTRNGGENRQALIQSKNGMLIITNTVFDKNTASKSGTSYGNVYVSDGKLYVENCNFTNNYNKYGTLYITTSQAKVYNSSFIGNNASSASGGQGAGIYVSGTSTTQSVSSGKVTNGTASDLLVKNCKFINNTVFGGTYYGGTGGAVYVNNNATVKIEDSLFENNAAITGGEAGKGGAIFASAGNITVTGSVFKDNTAEEGSEIYLKYYDSTSKYSIMLAPHAINKIDVKDSIFNNENDAIFVSTNVNYTVDANQNYWNNNDPSGKVNENIDLENWVIMDAKATPDDAQIGDNITIDVTFDKLKHADDTVSEYTGTLPEMDVLLVSTSGNLNVTLTVKEGKASINYTIDVADDGIAVGDSEYIPLVAGIIYVSPEGDDNNTGTESSPVKTIVKAIEISLKGKIVLLNGTHKTGDLGVISKDLTIIAQGEAIIDAQNNNRVLYVGSTANVSLEGITLINGYTSDESGALLGNSGNLTIINCTLANSTSSKNGGAVYNAGNLIVTDSTFENNKAGQNGGAIFTQNGGTGKVPTLAITNSAFTKNSATGSGNFGGGAVFAQQAAEGLSIENTNFTENTVEKSGGGAVEIVNVNAATITGCNFVSNSAKGEESDSNYGGAAISFVGAYSDKKETLTVTDSLFESNNLDGVGGGAIYARASTVNVASSALINNGDDSGYAIYSRITSMVTPSVTANDNWWGSSESPKSYVSDKVTLNRWAVLTVSNDTAFAEGENVTITADINSYTTGTSSGQMAKPIGVARDITLETSAGNIEGVLENGKFSTVFNTPAGLKYVDAIIDSQKENLFLVSTSTIVQIDNYTAKKGERPVYVINVTSSDGTIVDQGTVELFINEESIGIIDVENGTAKGKFVVSLANGNYDIVAKYTDEGGLFDENFGTATLKVSGSNGNYVYNSNFFNFFDEDGYMYDDIPFSSLSFREAFNAEDLGIDTLYINSPMDLNGYSSYAKFNNIKFDVMSSDVELYRLYINLDNQTSGAAVNVGADDVTLSSLTITYDTAKDTNAYAIRINGANNTKVSSATINFNSNSVGTPGYTQHAVEIRDSTNVLVSGGTINAKLPACDVDYSGPSGIDQDLILAIGVQDGENVTIKNVKLNTNVTDIHGSYPTVDSIMACDVANLEINKNTIKQNDFSNNGAGYSNAVDLYRCDNAKIVNNDILVNSTAGKEGSGTAYPIQLTGPYTGLLIDGNTLNSISCGPTLGIYSQNYAGATDITVTNNFINVTGLATNSSAWSLVSGMELQDTNAKIYNNTIYSQNTGDYDETNNLFGISYAQWLYGDHTFDIQDNAIFTEGKYAVYFLNAKDSNVIGNDLHAHDLWGNDAAIIKDGEGNVIRNNMPPYGAEVIIKAPNAFKGHEYVITVSVTNATEGNVTLKVNDKEFKDLAIVNGTVSQVVDFADLIDGINNVSAEYAGSEIVNPGKSNTTFIIVDGVITNSTFHNYFDENGYLLPTPEGATLNFQGPFVGAQYSVYINSPVNVITTLPEVNGTGLLGADYENYTGYAIFDSGENPNYNWFKFNVIKGADNTNITGITIINGDLFIQGASNVTVDNITMKANMRGVGSGTGFLAIHSESYNAVVKNSYFENGGTGSSCVVLGKGGKYATFDNNYFNITGSSGNVLSSNVFVGAGEIPQYVNYTNNVIDSHVGGSTFMYGITVCGQGNIIENNTLLNFKGNAIINQYGATSTKNIYRNNTITGGGSMAIGTYSLVENNNAASSTLTATEGCTFVNNTVKALNINGKNVEATENDIATTVTIAAAASNTTFANNTVGGLVTVNSNDNIISGNEITTTTPYAIDLKSTSNNTVTDNKLASADKLGDDAVKFVEDKNNTVVRNGGNPIMTIDVENVFIGNNNTIAIAIVNATGNVTVKVNDKEYKELKLTDGAVTIQLNASDIIAGVNNVTVTYNGDEFINVGTETTTFRGLDNVVTEDIFYEYFDDYGFLKEEIKFDELIFKGEFDKLLYYIHLDRPIKITGQDAVLKDIAIIIDTANVTIDNVDMISKMELGDLISVMGDNVALKNMNITYSVGDIAAYAINVHNVDNVKITDSAISFESKISSDDKKTAAVNIEGSSNVVLDNDNITARLPGLYMETYDFDYFAMGLINVNGIKIYESESVNFTNNKLDVAYNVLKTKSYPDIQAMTVAGCKDVIISGNDIKINDTLDDKGINVAIVGIQFIGNDNIKLSENDISIFTNGGQQTAGTAYPLTIIGTSMDITKNNISTESNGPTFGIYTPYGFAAAKEINVTENNIYVIGNVSGTNNWGLISGIEIQAGPSVNRIYNNYIDVKNKGGFNESYYVAGVSFVQNVYSGTDNVALDIQNNTIISDGNYTVWMIHGSEANVTGNTLYAHDLFGDDSVKLEIKGIVENNTPPFENVDILIDGQAAWIGTNSTITVTVPNGTGNVTIKVGNKTFEEVPLVNGTVTVDVTAEDLVAGANNVTVNYNGDKYISPTQSVGNLQVIDGVITNETFKYYFDKDNNNYLFDYVPENATLDFQGSFVGGDFSLFINKPENIVSTTGDAVFDSGENPNYNWFKFNVVAGANNTNITGISIVNGDLFIQGASYVTVDDIDMKANMRGVGSGTGFLAIHSEAYYTTVKNSHFENGGTGSSCVVLGKGGKYATFDNNVFDITGSSGNVLSSNIFVGKGENPEFVNYTNNVINSNVGGSAFMYGITVCGQGNIIENNTLNNFKGNAITNQWGATSTKNIYRNNTITGGGSMAIGTYSLVENNNLEGALTATEGCTFFNNTAKSLTISGKNVVATENDIATTVTIAAAAANTTFANNTVNGLVTVNSEGNIISDNFIKSDSEYAIDLKSSKNNTVSDNILYANELVGDAAVNFVEDNNNTVENNFPIDAGLIVEAADINVGENATINVSFKENVTGTVEVIVDAKKYVVDVINGKGQLNVSELPASKYAVGVNYDGDIIYTATNNSTTFTVNKVSVDDGINITVPSDVKAGDNATVDINIPNGEGNVSVIVDGKETTVPLVNGSAKVPVDNVSAGDHSVVVIYPGDDTHAPAHSASVFSVPEEPVVKPLATEITDVVISNELVITAVLKDENGQGIAKANVTYSVNGTNGTVVTDENGSFTVQGVNNAVIALNYAGDDNLLATNISITIDQPKAEERLATKFNVTSGYAFEVYAVDYYAGERGYLFNVLLSDTDGNPIANQLVQFGIQGVVHNKTSNESGIATLQINLMAANEYTCTPCYLGNTSYNATFSATKIIVKKKPITISAKAKTFKSTAKTKKFTVNIKTIVGSSVDGKVYLKAGKKLTLKINGKTYSAKTNAKGQATFKITKLTKKGKHNAVIKFAGDKTYNSATKKVKITIK